MKKNLEKIYAEALYNFLKESPKKTNETIAKFLNILKEKNLLHKIDKIIKEFVKIYNKKNNITELVVESVFPLDQNIVEQIAKAINITDYELETKINKELLGGLRVQYDDNLIDMSIKNNLKNLHSKLVA